MIWYFLSTRPGNPILEHTSPNSIILGNNKFDCSQTHLEFGSYAQVHDVTTNAVCSRTLGSIVLTPTGSANNSYHFLSLSLQSGHVYTRGTNQAIISPVTDIALSRLENLARLEGQPLIQDSCLLVEWRPDQPIDKDEYDYDFEPTPTTAATAAAANSLDNDFAPIDTNKLTALAPTLPPLDPAPSVTTASGAPSTQPVHQPENDDNDDDDINYNNDGYTPMDDDDQVIDNAADINASNSDGTGAPMDPDSEGIGASNTDDKESGAPDTTGDPTEEIGAQPETIHEAEATEHSHSYNLHANRQPNYSHLFPNKAGQSHTQKINDRITGIMFNQMAARAGYKAFGEDARNAMQK